MTDPVVLLSTGDVIGAASSTDGSMVLFDGTSGKKLKGNNATVTAQALALLDDVDAAANRATIGLNQVNNTSDLNKPISTATQTALDLKVDVTKQATESILGLAKVATQAQTNTGTDDATIVTPKKLRTGFSYLGGDNGYFIFPSWLGGFIIQWGLTLALVADGVRAVTLATAFPNSHIGGVSCIRKATPVTGGSNAAYYYPTSLSQATVLNESNNGTTCDVFWISLGS